MIYLDNASTTYVYPECIDIVKDISKYSWGNPSNLYTFGENSKIIIDDAREIIANTIKCKPEEIFFTSGSSEGNAWGMKQGSVTIASPYEHHSILENPNTVIIHDEWFKEYQEFNSIKKYIRRNEFKDCVYAHMLVSNETGEIFDVNPMFKIAHKLGAFVMCDMTQAFGNIEIDINKYDCDMAIFSGHKFHAPKGIGFVYIKENKIKDIVPLIYGTQQSEMRGGTENVAYIMAMAEAAKISNSEINLKTIKSRHFNSIILSELETSGIDFIVNRAQNNIPQTLNISLKNIESEIIQMLLSNNEIYIGVGSGCNNSLFESSKTLEAMKVPDEYIHGPIRFSYSMETSTKDVEIAIKELIKIYKEMTNA